MPDAPRTTQLYCDLSLAATGSSRKVLLLEGESGLTPARNTYPSRYNPDRACLEACLAEAAKGTDVDTQSPLSRPGRGGGTRTKVKIGVQYQPS